MNCPYCNEELEKLGFLFGNRPMEYRCKNPDCAKKYGDASIKVWQALIKTKQALDRALYGIEVMSKFDDGVVIVDVRSFAKHLIDQIKQITETKE